MDLYIVRHGQSTNNTGETHVPDPQLTEIGQRLEIPMPDSLPSHVAATLSGLGITHLYASPLLRALQTAKAISAEVGVSPRATPELCEFGGVPPHREGTGYAQGNGLTRAEIRALLPGATFSDDVTDHGWWFLERSVIDSDGPEIFLKARENAMSLIAQLKRDHDDADQVALVTHGGSGSLIIETLLWGQPEMDRQRFSLENTSLSLVRVSDQMTRARYVNRVTHLPAELIT